MFQNILGLVLLGLVAVGCTQVRSDYTKFDKLPASIDGKTVAFVPLEGQNGSAAWETYVDKVAARLAEYGMVRTDDISSADYAAVISYGTGDTRTISGVVPIYGQTGGGVSTTTGSIYGGGSTYNYSGTTYSPGTYGITGYMPYRRSKTDRFFSIRMVDLAASTPENLVAAYEGSVISSGRSKSFDLVADCMIKALFDDFRGSGSDRASLVWDDC